MALPVVKLPTAILDIYGTKVEVRGLSRSETLRLKDLAIEDADNLILSLGVGVTEEEAREWRETTSNEIVSILSDKIIELSGLLESSQGK